LAILMAAVVDRPAPAAGPFVIVTDSLPAGSIGVFYSQLLATSGGSCPATGNATSTIDSGALPFGLSVVSPAGVERWTIQGVPTASGTFQFALHIRWTHQGVSPFNPDCVDETVKTLTIAVQAPPVPQAPLTVDRTQISATVIVIPTIVIREAPIRNAMDRKCSGRITKPSTTGKLRMVSPLARLMTQAHRSPARIPEAQ